MSNNKGISDNRGGKRIGAGRKPIYEISDSELKQLVKAAKKKAKETGKSLADVLMGLAYQIDDKRTALQALRVYFERVIVKNTEKDITINPREPSNPLIISAEGWAAVQKLPPEVREELGLDAQVCLPPLKPDPAKLIADKKEQKETNVIKLNAKK